MSVPTHPKILLLDIGNTHAHIGWGDDCDVQDHVDLPTNKLGDPEFTEVLKEILGGKPPDGACYCSVVPAATEHVQKWLPPNAIPLTPKNLKGLGLDYPKPETIGQDRLANAVAAHHHFGAPCVVVDFGTAVTFDVIDVQGNYAGGIIAPGLATMTDYLHEKTALLPRVQIREPSEVIGKSTETAMLSGAVYGYRGLIRELIEALSRELKTSTLPVIATGGYATLIAAKLPEITAVRPKLTLEGLRLTWLFHHCPELSGLKNQDMSKL